MVGSPLGRGGARAAALVLAGVLAVSGCGGAAESDESAPSEAPSATPSESPAEEATASPGPEEPERPEAKDNPGSRKDFARFVVDRWGYALRTNQPKAVLELSPRQQPCQGCKDLRAELAKRKKQGWYVDFPGAKVRRVTVNPGEVPGTFVARATVDIPASRSYFDDGLFRNDNKAHKGATFEVRMRLDKKRYSLLAFRIT